MASARQVFVEGFAAARGASDVLVPRRPLGELFGESLPHELRRLGIELRTAEAVERIELNDTPIVQTTRQRLAADAVIIAVPWHGLGKLIDSELLPDAASFKRLPVSPITGIHLWFDREITPRQHAVLVGTTAQWLFRQPWQVDRDSAGEHYYQVVISAAHDSRRIDKSQLVHTVLAELQHAFPAARQAKCIRSRVVTDPRAVFSIRPEVEAIRPAARTALPQLHLAGDWIATGWPSTMEGAVISGRMAASSVCRQFGDKPVEIDPGLPRGWLARTLIRESPVSPMSPFAPRK